MKKIISFALPLFLFSACTETSPDILYTDQTAYIQNESPNTIHISYSTENQIFENEDNSDLKILSTIKTDSVLLEKQYDNEYGGGSKHKILEHISLGSQTAMTPDELNSKIHYLRIYKIVDGDTLKAKIDLSAYKAWNKFKPWDDNKSARTREFYFYVTDDLFE